jgi:hypothetical protein
MNKNSFFSNLSTLASSQSNYYAMIKNIKKKGQKAEKANKKKGR